MRTAGFFFWMTTMLLIRWVRTAGAAAPVPFAPGFAAIAMGASPAGDVRWRRRSRADARESGRIRRPAPRRDPRTDVSRAAAGDAAITDFVSWRRSPSTRRPARLGRRPGHRDGGTGHEQVARDERARRVAAASAAPSTTPSSFTSCAVSFTTSGAGFVATGSFASIASTRLIVA
jgi:hypothetical protein